MSKKTKKVKTTWNYQIVKVETAYGPDWGIYEVYYTGDRPIARTQDPLTFTSEDGADALRGTMATALADACNRPVLDDAEIGGTL